jgi:ankyrin repeat protein
VYCQLEALRHCLPPSVARILEELPETLDETYERVLREINKANREHARRLLQCLTVALRPLHVEELAEVLAIDFDAPAHGGVPQLNPKWRWADQHQAILSTCSSLIAIVDDGVSKVVQFSHFSVKEYLTSDRLARTSGDVSRYHIVLDPAHTILAQACLGVLLRLDDHVYNDNVGNIPLVEYAAQYWVDHARFEKVASHIRDAMEYFFDADKPHWTAWCRVQMIDHEWLGFTPARSPDAFPLYYASLGGFYDLAKHLVGKHPEHINARGGEMGTPFVAALGGKHFEVAELLHRNGADVDIRDNSGDTPLREACKHGVLDTAQWLLNHRADVNTQGIGRRAPLHSAAGNGHSQVIRMLIEHNADIHIQNDYGDSPLHIAASPYSDVHVDVNIMQVLLDHGANPNARDNHNSTPLHHSSWNTLSGRCNRGTVEGTRLLLKHGAIIDAEDNKGRTPLQLALENGCDEIATCLKEHGATR